MICDVDETQFIVGLEQHPRPATTCIQPGRQFSATSCVINSQRPLLQHGSIIAATAAGFACHAGQRSRRLGSVGHSVLAGRVVGGSQKARVRL